MPRSYSAAEVVYMHTCLMDGGGGGLQEATYFEALDIFFCNSLKTEDLARYCSILCQIPTGCTRSSNNPAVLQMGIWLTGTVPDITPKFPCSVSLSQFLFGFGISFIPSP